MLFPVTNQSEAKGWWHPQTSLSLLIKPRSFLLGWWQYPQFPHCFSNNFPHFWLSINPVPAEGSSAEQWSIWTITINIIIVVIVIIIINIIIHMGPEDNFCSTKISKVHHRRLWWLWQILPMPLLLLHIKLNIWLGTSGLPSWYIGSPIKICGSVFARWKNITNFRSSAWRKMN